MFFFSRLCFCLSTVLFVCCLTANSHAEVSHNNTRSNRGSLNGGGDASEKDLYVSNDKIVRKKPGRTTYSDVTLTSGTSEGQSKTLHQSEQFVENDETFVSIVEQFLLQSSSESQAIEYGLIAALMSDGEAETIEYALIVALMGDASDEQTLDVHDIIVRKKPGRVADESDLGSGGNHGSGSLRNNDPIPGIDVIVDVDPEAYPALDNSPVMMLNAMLEVGYSQAEVVEFALATGLIGL